MSRSLFLYIGKGAYQAKDVELFLSVFDIDYYRICEHELEVLQPDAIFIVPGGEIRSILPAWGEEGVKKIRTFVEAGGSYIGICAGAYVAGEQFHGVNGLGFFSGELDHKKRKEIVDVTDEEGKAWRLVVENGPDFSSITSDRVLLKDQDGAAVAIEITQGNGRAILFAGHPEGSAFDNQFPKQFSGARYLERFLKRLQAEKF